MNLTVGFGENCWIVGLPFEGCGFLPPPLSSLPQSNGFRLKEQPDIAIETTNINMTNSIKCLRPIYKTPNKYLYCNSI